MVAGVGWIGKGGNVAVSGIAGILVAFFGACADLDDFGGDTRSHATIADGKIVGQGATSITETFFTIIIDGNICTFPIVVAIANRFYCPSCGSKNASASGS